MAHAECNVLRTRQKTINIYCHNGSAFDFHFLVCEKLEDKRINYIDGLPDSQERLRLIRLNEYVFKDSITFLKNSLDSLIKDLKVRILPIHSRYFLFETTQVPGKVDYYSALSNTHIDEDTYLDIKKFWSLFNCKHLADYSSYYVRKKVVMFFFDLL